MDEQGSPGTTSAQLTELYSIASVFDSAHPTTCNVAQSHYCPSIGFAKQQIDPIRNLDDCKKCKQLARRLLNNGGTAI